MRILEQEREAALTIGKAWTTHKYSKQGFKEMEASTREGSFVDVPGAKIKVLAAQNLADKAKSAFCMAVKAAKMNGHDNSMKVASYLGF